ncbi:ArsR/SmtB family transcription factor [Aliidiomarina soli]|uniref:ArsR/SmtB family transcription factor n=1 Tax=Aliidiomarina soli TaxID=1928574 RepID=UPI001F53E776|nr:metalloregulator ArsR/SmtB family transcription factor [Aliidiomarina soli]
MNTQHIDMAQIEEKSGEAATLLKLLSNQHRLLILCHLVEGELCVSELEERLSISQSSLSQHLARLREQGIVEFRKESTTVYYHLADAKAQKVLETLYELFCGA